MEWRGAADSLGDRPTAVTWKIYFLIGSLPLSPLDVAYQSQDSLSVSGGSYAQTDQGVMIQVCEVSSQ